jgi:antitoxin (DNA-binding transcriptional repressor) of toxin-antitoxin stability system
MHRTIGIGQLRSATRYYLELAASGESITVKRRGIDVASIHPPGRPTQEHRRRLPLPGHLVIRVALPAFRSAVGRYLGMVANGAVVDIYDRGQSAARITRAADA